MDKMDCNCQSSSFFAPHQDCLVVSVSAVGDGFAFRPGQTKDHHGTNCLPPRHAGVRVGA